jgi:hypothetical protein
VPGGTFEGDLAHSAEREVKCLLEALGWCLYPSLLKLEDGLWEMVSSTTDSPPIENICLAGEIAIVHFSAVK